MSSNNPINVNDLVQAYRAIRDERERILKVYEEEDSVLKTAIEKLQASLLSICNETGADSFKTASGTVIRNLKERYYTNDWDNFNKFILEHQAVDLLEKRIHQGNFKTYLENNPDAGLPPGVQVLREYTIQVRKPPGK